MLKFVHGRASDRKIRLFDVACCRRIWHLLTDERCRHYVEMAERVADGQEAPGKLRAARRKALDAYEDDRVPARRAVHSADGRNLMFTASATAEAYAGAAIGRVSPYSEAGYRAYAAALAAERSHLCQLVRDVFGNLFWAGNVDPTLLEWNDRTVVRIAQDLYDKSRFADVPILADALEEAGCADQAIISHCRSPGPHVKGCWVVDKILGKL
jgi:hypothetical protein